MLRKTVMNILRVRNLFLLCVSLLLPSIAYAYIDPGSGSVIVTTVLGIFAAIGYTCRKYFYKARRAIFGSKSEDEDQLVEPEDQQD